MKTKVFLTALASALLCTAMSVSAQDSNKKSEKRPVRPNKEEMQKMRTQRMAKELMLDDVTTAKFTTLYDEYVKELQACMPERPEMKNDDEAVKDNDKAKAPKELTDNEIEKAINTRFANERKRIDIQENYYKKFSKILTQKQVLKVMMQERGPQNMGMRQGMRNGLKNGSRQDMDRRNGNRNNRPDFGNDNPQMGQQ